MKAFSFIFLGKLKNTDPNDNAVSHLLLKELQKKR
jgi:hypothetical protein